MGGAGGANNYAGTATDMAIDLTTSASVSGTASDRVAAADSGGQGHGAAPMAGSRRRGQTARGSGGRAGGRRGKAVGLVANVDEMAGSGSEESASSEESEASAGSEGSDDDDEAWADAAVVKPKHRGAARASSSRHSAGGGGGCSVPTETGVVPPPRKRHDMVRLATILPGRKPDLVFRVDSAGGDDTAAAAASGRSFESVLALFGEVMLGAGAAPRSAAAAAATACPIAAGGGAAGGAAPAKTCITREDVELLAASLKLSRSETELDGMMAMFGAGDPGAPPGTSNQHTSLGVFV